MITIDNFCCHPYSVRQITEFGWRKYKFKSIFLKGVNMKTRSGLKIINIIVAVFLLLGLFIGSSMSVTANSNLGSPADIASELMANDRAVGVVEVDGLVTSNTADDVTAITLTGHTTGTGENRLMLVGVSWNCGGSDIPITSVEFAYGDPVQTLTLEAVITHEQEGQGSPVGSRFAAIYATVDSEGALVQPPAGVSGTVTITFGSQVTYGIVAGAVNFMGVSLDDPLGIPGSAGQTLGTEPSVTLTGLAGTELIFDTAFLGSVSYTLTPAIEQTELWNDTIGNAIGAASIKPTDGNESVTMSWTPSNETTWILAAVPINPVVIPEYTITASAGVNGVIDPSGDVTVLEGDDQTFTITPDTNYVVDDVLVDDVSVGAVTEYTFSNVTADHTIEASFKLVEYTITATAGVGGSIDPSGEVLVAYGGNQTFTITPNTGYLISDVLVDEVSVGDVTEYTFTNVTSDHTIEASFELIEYTITATAGLGGSIAPLGDVIVAYGGEQTFTITPDVDYQVSDVLVDDVSVGAVTEYTFTNVTADHTIEAVFEPIVYEYYLPIIYNGN